MTNIPKQTEYWCSSAEEDFDVGKNLINAGKIRHGLFFLHLALEKMLKACLCKNQGKTPPKIHNLPRLAELAKIKLDQSQKDALR
jgi:HEPN domain-containing protein